MEQSCGAKTRSGGECKKAPLKGKSRCKLHGGASSGPPVGSKNALKHGIYGKYLSADENEIASNLELGSIDDELRLTKIRLMRALTAEQNAPDVELEERTERDGAANAVAKLEEKFKRRDYIGIIDKLTARIQSLERDRANLLDQNLNAEIKRNEIKNSGGKQNDAPIGKIIIEVASARNKNGNDGAAS